MPPAANTHTIRRLTGSDAASYRDLRLLGLRLHPEAFGATLEEEADLPVSWYAERLDSGIVIGAANSGAETLDGIVGLRVTSAAKMAHKAALWGMFVRPEARGARLGEALIAAAIDRAPPSVEEITLVVSAPAEGAQRLYQRMGFERYGIEPRGLKIGDTYLDDFLMALRLPRAQTP